MNRPLRHVWLVVSVLFVLLFTSTTYFQVIAQGRLNAHGQNDRTLYNEYGRHRGPIVVDGHAIAVSQSSDDTYGYLRTYDPGAMYAPVTGYYSVVYGFTGLERSLNDTLSGEADALFYHRISDILSGRQGRGATVELTLDAAAQEAAWDALDGRRGSVVALDPETGAVLAMVSSPSYDPNQLASHDSAAVNEAWTALQEDPDRPLTNRAIGGDLYPPGSSFKLVVAAAALETGEYTAESEIPGPGTWQLPNSSAVMNNHAAGGTEPCGPEDTSTLADALRQSCNTSFAMLGVDLGQEQLRETAEEFGFGQSLEIPMSVTPSTLGEDLDDAQLATTSIGQYETRVTPLQMAMVAGAFANDGVVMQPQLVQAVRTSDLTAVSELTPQELGQPVTAANAAQMRQMMVGVVEDGTGTAAAIDGVEVGGKTGTAQWGEDRTPHSWYVGYGQLEDRKIALAVVVEEGGYGSRTAAPIAQDVMEAVILP
ncbi:peptidoglycan D,D-transpeptidase FtsI family protein [Brachybacterium saurashtrense]|uniref:Penicillin-binding protein 2 n=1 Tax=Brachybacterium saurashtrense TaxID=556288 RepID=A0A345YQB5_9MICO|nr:penicillin-binding transpeptidase domain-containing protein [Brachybacterium saurashtrense]AXK46117.1 penicillin-binding protein 2 [Brachybacterium saurashtrense]RRR23857.1 penicillin-binding protein 2 [Brachybacterium saurashtrense]